MEINSEFRQLSLKLVQDYGKITDVSNLLNELNSIDYKIQIIDEKHIFDFFETLTRLIKFEHEPRNNNNVTKLIILIDQIIANQKVSIPASVSCKVIKWILDLAAKNSIVKCDFICEALGAIRSLLKFTESGPDNNNLVRNIIHYIHIQF